MSNGPKELSISRGKTTKFVSLDTIIAQPIGCCNRDANGMPKSANWGGVERGRNSSQTRKRCVKDGLASDEEFAENFSAVTVKLNSDFLTPRLVERLLAAGHSADESDTLAARYVEEFMASPKDAERVDKAEKAREAKKAKAAKKVKADGREIPAEANQDDEPVEIVKGVAVAFLARSHVAAICDLIVSQGSGDMGPGRKKLANLINKQPIPKDGFNLLIGGRMFADCPELNIDSGVYVSHAVTTHEAITEFDYFTTTQTDSDTQGAAHIGENGYNSGVYYECVAFNLTPFSKAFENAGIAKDRIRVIMGAIVSHFLTDRPTGRKATYFNWTMPKYAVAIGWSGNPCSMADAFEEPVQPGQNGGYLSNSILAYEEHLRKFQVTYGRKTGCKVVSKLVYGESEFESFIEDIVNEVCP